MRSFFRAIFSLCLRVTVLVGAVLAVRRRLSACAFHLHTRVGVRRGESRDSACLKTGAMWTASVFIFAGTFSSRNDSQ